jgi:uncharacterized Zn finger protein (UPF0148 family)
MAKHSEQDTATGEVDILDTDIVFHCEHCGKSLAIDRRGIGMTITCPDCGQDAVVPEISEPIQADAPDAEGLELTPDQRIEYLSNALQASHEDIRRLSGHLTEVSKRRKVLETLRARHIHRMERVAEEMVAMQAAIDRVLAVLQDSAGEEIGGDGGDDAE